MATFRFIDGGTPFDRFAEPDSDILLSGEERSIGVGIVTERDSGKLFDSTVQSFYYRRTKQFDEQRIDGITERKDIS